MADGYRLAFDATQSPFPFGGVFLLLLALPAVGLLLVVVPQSIVDRVLPNGPKGTTGKVYGGLFFLFTGSIATTWIWNSVGQYNAYKSAERSGKIAYLSGCLEGFHPMPWEGHEDEVVKVGGRIFTYSDSEITGAFNQSASYGGPIHADSSVRIGYLGPDIVRLEVRDHACPKAPDLPKPN